MVTPAFQAWADRREKSDQAMPLSAAVGERGSGSSACEPGLSRHPEKERKEEVETIDSHEDD
jgi:hypothetical protein